MSFDVKLKVKVVKPGGTYGYSVGDIMVEKPEVAKILIAKGLVEEVKNEKK